MLPNDRILEIVGHALTYQFSVYSWHDMIDDVDDLTPEEKEWAKKNIDYKAYIV